MGLALTVRLAGVVALLRDAVKTPGGLPGNPLPGGVGATEIATVLGGVVAWSEEVISNAAETGAVEPGAANTVWVPPGPTVKLG